MSRSTIILVIVLIVVCLFFGAIFSTCSTPGRAYGLPGGGIWPILIGGGSWDRGGWDRGGTSSSPSSPSSGRGAAGSIRGGGISGGSGGK